MLGYPDQAIEDACWCLREGKAWRDLARAQLPPVARYGRAQPIFSYAPGHASDSGIVETLARWNTLLKRVYASRWHIQLTVDPAFQAARRTRSSAISPETL